MTVQAPRLTRNVVVRAKIETMNAEQLEVALAEREKITIIDFFATWCGPCVLLAQELEKVADELGEEVRIIKVDVDANQELSSALKIEGLPTTVFLPKDGRAALRTEGLLPASQIIEMVRDLNKPEAPMPQ